MSVYKVINAVQADLAHTGIGKESENKFDGYKFRGIDAVYNALAPLLAKHGLCILPRMLNRTVDERASRKGDALFYVTVEAEFDFVSAEDGSKHTIRTFGEAMDRGDKATNKAMSAAYKYAAFQAFAIPTEGDNDADATSHEVAAKAPRHSPTMGALEALPEAEREPIRDLAMEVIAEFRGTNVAGQKAMIATVDAQRLDDAQKTALWSLLDSSTRAAYKKLAQPAKEIA